MNKFLKKCQKVFKDKDLILLYGKYPINLKENKGRNLKINLQQTFMGNLLYKNNFPFMFEKKIIHTGINRNHHYLDIFTKGKYHFFDLEIDGFQHLTNKTQIKRDVRKEIFLLEKLDIITERILNTDINKYPSEPDEVLKKLDLLNKKCFNCFNKDFYIAKKIGILKRKLSEL